MRAPRRGRARAAVRRTGAAVLAAVLPVGCAGPADGEDVIARLVEADVVACDEVAPTAGDLWVCRTGGEILAAVVDEPAPLVDFIRARLDAGHPGPWVLADRFVVEAPPSRPELAAAARDVLGGRVVDQREDL